VGIALSSIGPADIDVAGLLQRLAALGPPSEVRAQSPQLVGEALGFDRVLLSSIRGGMLVGEAASTFGRDDSGEVLARLRAEPVALEYPLVEVEIMRRRRAQVVRAELDASQVKPAIADLLGGQYVSAPLVMDGAVTGFLHADRHASGGELVEEDASALAAAATCLAVVFERAVLRRRLLLQRDAMRGIATWASATTGELGDRAVTLADASTSDDEAVATRTVGPRDSALRDLLTPRELEVLRLMVSGETNAGIAREFVISEGTVKFHVKNILRKLQAANRAEATSRYLRLTLTKADNG